MSLLGRGGFSEVAAVYVGVFSAVAVLLFGSFEQLFFRISDFFYFASTPTRIVLVSGGVLIVFSISYVLLRVLRVYRSNVFEGFKDAASDAAPIETLALRIDELQNKILKLQPPNHLEKDQVPQSADAVSEAKRPAAGDTIARDYKEVMKQSELWNSISANIELIIKSLEYERLRVSSRSATNMTIGLFVGVTGLAVLLVPILSGPPAKEEVLQFAGRLGGGLAIQVLAYFFLSLYKAGLHEIRVYRNEITNLQSWRVGLQIALVKGNAATVGDVARKLVNTERNFILNKGQTTVETQKMQERTINADLTNAFAEVLRQVRAKEKKPV